MTETEGNPLMDNVMFILLLAGAIVIVALVIWGRMNGAETWADITIKEISKTINLAEPGDKIEIDIHDQARVAKRNNVINLDETFTVNNKRNEACVKLSRSSRKCFYFFNEVDIIDIEIIAGAFTENDRTKLTFEITETKQEDQENA